MGKKNIKLYNLIFIIFINFVLFFNFSYAAAPGRYDIMPEVVYGWMYYAEGWNINSAWGDALDVYIRFCHPEFSGRFVPSVRQALAYLKNIMGMDFRIHWNEAVPLNSDAPSLYIGDPLNGFCCYDGESYGYISVVKACMYKRDTYTFGNSAFIAEKKASSIYFYRQLADIVSSINTNWHSRYWNEPGATILKGGFESFDVPSPIDDQLLHIVAIWNRELRKSWHTDYYALARAAAQLRVEDAPIAALSASHMLAFSDLWNNNESWCPSEMYVSGNDITITTYLNLIYPEDTFTEHWYKLTLNCKVDEKAKSIVCPLAGINVIPEKPSKECTGAFVYLIDDYFPFRLTLYRVSLGGWSSQLESGRYIYLRFVWDNDMNALVLELYGYVNPF